VMVSLSSADKQKRESYSSCERVLHSSLGDRILGFLLSAVAVRREVTGAAGEGGNWVMGSWL
jgi:hypothetical protein